MLTSHEFLRLFILLLKDPTSRLSELRVNSHTDCVVTDSTGNWSLRLDPHFPTELYYVNDYLLEGGSGAKNNELHVLHREALSLFYRAHALQRQNMMKRAKNILAQLEGRPSGTPVIAVPAP